MTMIKMLMRMMMMMKMKKVVESFLIFLKNKTNLSIEIPDEEIEEESDSREHLNLVFIGHVDAGKFSS